VLPEQAWAKKKADDENRAPPNAAPTDTQELLRKASAGKERLIEVFFPGLEGTAATWEEEDSAKANDWVNALCLAAHGLALELARQHPPLAQLVGHVSQLADRADRSSQRHRTCAEVDEIRQTVAHYPQQDRARQQAARARAEQSVGRLEVQLAKLSREHKV
jgi:hypothetical protein